MCFATLVRVGKKKSAPGNSFRYRVLGNRFRGGLKPRTDMQGLPFQATSEQGALIGPLLFLHGEFEYRLRQIIPNSDSTYVRSM